MVGHPVTEWDLAKQVAQRMSAAQERKRNQDAAEKLGFVSKTHTLPELLERRHADLSPKWSGKYEKSRERRRDFWLTKLGSIELVKLNAALVERIALEEQRRRGLSDRWRQDVLRYLVDSVAYGEKKLKWIGPEHNLSAVDIPSAKGKSSAYGLDEAKKVLAALAEIEDRAGWIGQVCFQTGRRIGSVRQIRKGDIADHGTHVVITFRRSTDKAGKESSAVAVLPPRTDWRVPSYDVCKQWLRDAEEAAGVPTIKGRGWHGFKRLYATLTAGLPGADLQAGTLASTLDGIYRQDALDPKLEVAKRLSAMWQK